MSDRCIRELALNFTERMKQHKMHNLLNTQIEQRQRREERMIEFFTGAYVAFRHLGRKNEAEAIGVFTATVLAKLGYGACCGAAGVPIPHAVSMKN